MASCYLLCWVGVIWLSKYYIKQENGYKTALICVQAAVDSPLRPISPLIQPVHSEKECQNKTMSWICFNWGCSRLSSKNARCLKQRTTSCSTARSKRSVYEAQGQHTRRGGLHPLTSPATSHLLWAQVYAREFNNLSPSVGKCIFSSKHTAGIFCSHIPQYIYWPFPTAQDSARNGEAVLVNQLITAYPAAKEISSSSWWQISCRVRYLRRVRPQSAFFFLPCLQAPLQSSGQPFRFPLISDARFVLLRVSLLMCSP